MYLCSTELIETLWNVNSERPYALTAQPPELIETLWNVNMTRHEPKEKYKWELIETLWNVNDDANVNDVVKIRINRNIVKCK